jgi:hypothetical protein
MSRNEMITDMSARMNSLSAHTERVMSEQVLALFCGCSATFSFVEINSQRT